jgi:hypothetical protein
MVENDAIVGEINAHFGGNYLNEETLLAAARKAGFLTAAVGKVGPAAIYDVTERTGAQTIVIDDLTGRPGGLPLSERALDALQAVPLPNQAPLRGANGKVGDAKTPGTTVANIEQQRYFVDVATRSILPMFKAAGKTVCAGVLVARPGRHAAQSGRQPGATRAWHQRSRFSGRREKCR